LATLAHIHQQRRTLDFSARLHVQFTECGNQRDGKIINTVKSEILKSFKNGAFPGAAEAGEDHQLPGVARISPLHSVRPTP